MKRLMVVLASTGVFLLLTINLFGSSPARAREASGLPQLIVTPSELTVLPPLGTSAIHTRTLFISNAAAGTTLTWSLSISSVQVLPQAYLPLIAKNYSPEFPAPVAPPLGLNFISSAKYGSTATRYQRALAINGKLNRWPLYWNEIETQAVSQPRVYNWTAADSNIAADINHGLTVLPILMFTPSGLDTGGSRLAPLPQVGDGLPALLNHLTLNLPSVPSSVTTPPQGLYLSVFADDTDTPGPGKSINPDNRWAYFVSTAVSRYRPGGTLSQQQGWNDARGVRYWEIWNEPDLDTFFTGTITDYARLLKVAYLSARSADPQAQIVLGGMAHWQKAGWFSSLLDLIQTDPAATANHYFMDKAAVHNYFWAWQTFGYLYPDRAQLDSHGLQDIELWVTETGVPVCGEGSFPACNDPQNRWYRAAPDEQAAYLIQSAAYAAWLKTESYVWFQLFDDCGNQCGVDAYGLVRNDNTPRLSYQTYPLIYNQLTNVQPYWRDRRTITATNWISGNQEIIAFKRPATSERIVVMWTRYYTDATVVLTATAPSARLYYPDGSFQTIFPSSGTYAIPLPRASNRNFPGTSGGVAPENTGSAPIGGSPRILVENDPAAK